MTLCWPWWHSEYNALINSPAGKRVVSSGCATVGGNVQCKPEDMARAAGVSLPIYTLARYGQSEVGSGPAEERVAVMEAAVNRAKLAGTDILARLLYRQPVGHPNRGYYGPIHGDGFEAPYNRWASTSKDPTVGTLALAELVMSGRSGNFNQGADDQNGMQYASAFPSPEASIRNQAAEEDYWVGPLPGVNPWRTFLYRHYGYKASSPEGQALINRALAFVAQRRREGSMWVGTLPVPAPDCVDNEGMRFSGGAIVGMILLGSAILGAAIYAGRVAAGRA